MECTLTHPRMKLHLQLRGKFNVIIGDSGTGKSYLCKLVEEIRNTYGFAGQQPLLVCGGRAAVVRIPLWAKEYQGALLVLDEMQDADIWESYLDIMKKSHNYYIVCTREGDSKIPYGVDTTFKLERSATSLKMVPAYGNIATRNPRGFTSIITEDEGVGYEVVRRQSCLSVSSAHGKDNIANKIHLACERALVLLDLCGVGMAYPRILAEASQSRSILFDSKSFEYEVLTTVFRNIAICDYDKVCLQEDSEEAYYTRVLSDVLLQICGAGYSKSSEELADLLITGKGMLHGHSVDLTQYGDISELYPFLRRSRESGVTSTKSIKQMNLE